MSNVLMGQTVRLWDVMDEEFAIRDLEFVGCHITGPVTLAPHGCRFIRSTSTAPREGGFLIEATRSGEHAGYMLAERCQFVGCTFDRVSLALTPHGYRELLAALTAEDAGT